MVDDIISAGKRDREGDEEEDGITGPTAKVSAQENT